MILDYSGKGATEIFQDLVTRQGVRLTDLADLYRKTGATNETEVPAFIKVENNSIVDYSDTPFAEETEEVTTESASPELQNYLTTTEMTLAEPQPGVETFDIQKQDPRFSVQNEVMRQQEQNLPTLDMPEAVAEPPAQMNVGEEVVSVQDVPGPTPEVPEMVPEDAQKVLAGEPLKEPEAKPAEAEGARAIGIASTIMPEADGTRTITEEELKAYPASRRQFF